MENKSVYIVEDETVVALDIRRTLQRMGYEVCGISSSGEDVVEKLRTVKPHVVLMDIMLDGEMSGITAAQIIKERYGIPVIFSTAYSDDQTIRLAKITEPFGYIHKPFQEKELRANIEMALYKCNIERRLRESERRFRLLYENMPLSYQTLDEEGKFIEVNDIWLSLIGYERTEVIGALFDKFLSDESRRQFKEFLCSLRDNEELNGINLEVIHKNGHAINVILDGKISFDKAKDSKLIHCVIRDVSEKKRREETQVLTLEILELLNRAVGGDDLIRTILERIKNAFNIESVEIRLSHGSDFPYLFYNEFTKEFVNTNFLPVSADIDVTLEKSDRFRDVVVAGAQRKQHPYLTEKGSFWTNKMTAFGDDEIKKILAVQMKNAEPYLKEGYESIAIIPLKSDDKIIGLLQLNDKRPDRFTSETITIFECLADSIGIAVARMTAEKDILQAKEQAENLNNAMTAALESQKKLAMELESARKQAEAANRAKSAFLANISHEIKTPISGIIGFSSSLGDTELSEQQQTYLEDVQSSTETLLTLVNDIIDLTKIDSGLLELQEIDFNLRNMISSVVDIVLPAAHEKGLHLATLINAAVGESYIGDPGRIRQILLNLVNNAIKFTERGEIVISVDKKKDIDDFSSLCFTVKDTGIGISQEDQKCLFTTFTQVDGTATRKYGGAGIGLVISKQLVELMGGKIELESKQEAGSTFCFEIPLKCGKKDTDAFREITDLKNLAVLVIDSNRRRLKQKVALLQSWKCCVYETADIDKAYTLLHDKANSSINIKIILIEAGVLSTELISKSCKLLTISPRPHLVLITSVGSRGDAALVSSKGFSAYLTKPLSGTELFNCLTMLKTKEPAPIESIDKELLTRHLIQDRKIIDKRILLAEDNIMIQTLTAIILRKAGFACDIVNNGLECVDAVEKGRYDLILMDCQMPEMNGYEASKKIRAMNMKRIPIIALTASTLNSDREACKASGMDDVLTKPVDQDQLIHRIEYWIEGKSEGTTTNSDIVNKQTAGEIPTLDELLQILKIERGSMEVILKQFFTYLPKHLEKIEKSLNDKDFTTAQKVIHTLKGACGNIRLRRAVYLLTELEESLAKREENRIENAYRNAGEYLKKASNVLSDPQIVNSPSKEITNDEKIPKIIPERAALLYRLFEQGDLNGIAETVHTWSASEEPLRFFYNRIEMLAKDFKESEIDEVIKTLVESSGNREVL